MSDERDVPIWTALDEERRNRTGVFARFALDQPEERPVPGRITVRAPILEAPDDAQEGS